MVLGTVGYMAPEQVRGLAVDHRSDIFAFGAILYEMLSGQRAFRGETGVDAMMAILKDEPPPHFRGRTPDSTGAGGSSSAAWRSTRPALPVRRGSCICDGGARRAL